MDELKIGDIVARKSHGYDILFKVVDIQKGDPYDKVVLHGVDYRIVADAPLSDVEKQSESRIKNEEQRFRQRINQCCARSTYSNEQRYVRPTFRRTRSTPYENAGTFYRKSKVLHLDSDSDFLDKCLEQYNKFGITAVGKNVSEREQPGIVASLIREHRPDILVLTGHDGMIKDGKAYADINNYTNSKYFVQSVLEARRVQPDMDNFIIFAGACQSNYNAIIEAGANFASSPYRVLIHALDPPFVCQKIVKTGLGNIIMPYDVVANTITGYKGIGGVQTRGMLREGYPKEPYLNV